MPLPKFSKLKPKTTKRGRDSETGKFIPVAETKKRPKTTTVEKVKVARKRKLRKVSLDDLVKSGTLSSFSTRILDRDGNPLADDAIPGDSSRETEELTLTFPSGEVLVIGTFCSGCAENTCFLFSTHLNVK